MNFLGQTTPSFGDKFTGVVGAVGAAAGVIADIYVQIKTLQTQKQMASSASEQAQYQAQINKLLEKVTELEAEKSQADKTNRDKLTKTIAIGGGAVVAVVALASLM